MPSMVRTRFATPDDRAGVDDRRDGRGRGRPSTPRAWCEVRRRAVAGPDQPGDADRARASGCGWWRSTACTLEVEPEEGGARDYRERRRRRRPRDEPASADGLPRSGRLSAASAPLGGFVGLPYRRRPAGPRCRLSTGRTLPFAEGVPVMQHRRGPTVEEILAGPGRLSGTAVGGVLPSCATSSARRSGSPASSGPRPSAPAARCASHASTTPSRSVSPTGSGAA